MNSGVLFKPEYLFEFYLMFEWHALLPVAWMRINFFSRAHSCHYGRLGYNSLLLQPSERLFKVNLHRNLRNKEQIFCKMWFFCETWRKIWSNVYLFPEKKLYTHDDTGIGTLGQNLKYVLSIVDMWVYSDSAKKINKWIKNRGKPKPVQYKTGQGAG